MLPFLSTSAATICVAERPVSLPEEVLAYAVRTVDASVASILLSPLTSPSCIVTTDGDEALSGVESVFESFSGSAAAPFMERIISVFKFAIIVFVLN